jgi:hypothetical protein
MNHRALELTGHLDQTETGPATTTLSRLVRELRVQIQDTLESRRKADIWELFELKRDMVETVERSCFADSGWRIGIHRTTHAS